jgi:predicted nucleotidyltransferase component of viral defense system
MNKEYYTGQVNLLLNCLPALENQTRFAIKGGTAINFFIRDLPRLSIDIDLTYLKTAGRDESIKDIEYGLREISNDIRKLNKNYKIRNQHTKAGLLSKIIVSDHAYQIKIEPNFIMRGSLEEPLYLNISKSIEEKFEFSVKSIPVISKEELYAGKLCAALSRQHPRDFFDVHELFENEGITDGIRKAFVVYLACSPRPIHELLNPNLIDLNHVYQSEFVNMADHEVSLSQLLNTRDKLIKTVNSKLTTNEKEFLLSIKEGAPKYDLMPFNNLDKLPALNWKLRNVKLMNHKKHADMLAKLGQVLDN